MKRGSFMVAGMVFCLSLGAQDELTVEDVLAKIEARLSGIQAVSIDVARTLDFETSGTQFVGRVTFVPGKLRIQTLEWGIGRRLDIREEFYDAKGSWYRRLSWLKGDRTFAGFGRIEPGAPPSHLGFDVAMYPRALTQRFKGLKAFRQQTSIVLEGHRDLDTARCFFDAKTLRFERSEQSFKGRTTVLRCEAYDSVRGVEIPSRLVWSTNTRLDVMHLSQPSRFEGPSWISDPAFDPPAEALLEASRRWQEPKKSKDKTSAIRTTLEKGLAAFPQSTLMNQALFLSCIEAGDDAASQTILERGQKANLDCSALLAISAMRKLAAKDSASEFPSDELYAPLSANLKIWRESVETKTAGDLAAIVLRECSGRKALGQIGVVDTLEPLFSHGILEDKPEAWLVELAKAEQPSIALMVGRAAHHLKKPDVATDCYSRVAATGEFRTLLLPELQYWTLQAPDATKLLDTIGEEATRAAVLLMVAERYLDQGQADKCERTLTRAIQASKEAVEPGKLMQLVKKLDDQGKADRACELAIAFVNPTNAMFFMAGNFHLLKRLFAGRKERACDFLKAAGEMNSNCIELLDLDAKEIFAMLKVRLETKWDLSDAVAVAQFVEDKAHRESVGLQEITRLLIDAVKRRPDAPELQEGLGDALALSGQFDKAADQYKTWLAHPPQAVRSWYDDDEDKNSFTTNRPVIVKYAYVLIKLGDAKAALEGVEAFAKSVDSNTLGEAYQTLGRFDRSAELKRPVFLKGLKSGSLRNVVEAGVALGNLYVQAKQYDRAYVVTTLLLQRQPRSGESVEALRAEVLKHFSEEDLIATLTATEAAPLTDAELKTLRDLIGQLDDDDPATRQAASSKLKQFGARGAKTLQAISKEQAPEAVARIRQVLRELAEQGLREQFLRP